jgi:hypothetical protein
VREAVKPITVAHDALAFHIVQNCTHLFGRIFTMIEERDETRDGALKIDVVFPERIVGIDEQRLFAIRFVRT